jgi:hypothetical protein
MSARSEPSYFGPEDVESLKEALDWALVSIRPPHRAEANKTRLARHIVMRASEGERDPIRLRDYALRKVRLRTAWLNLDR